MGDVRETLTHLKNAKNEKGKTILVGKLLNVLTQSKGDEREGVVLEIWQVLDSLGEVEEVLFKIFLQIGKLDILPLLTDLLRNWIPGHSEEAKKLANQLRLADEIIWRKLISLGSNGENLKMVIEILYYMANRYVVLEAPALLKLIRRFWQEEKLFYGSVKLVIKLWQIDCEKIKIHSPAMEQKGVVSNISELMGRVFEKDSFVFDNIFNFLGSTSNSALPLIIEWLEALLLGHINGQKMLKAIRPIIPILSEILKDGHVNAKSSLIYRNKGYSDVILKVLCILLKSSRTDFERDFKLVLESQVMINLMKVFEEHHPEAIFLAPLKSGDESGTSSFFKTIELFMNMLSKNTLPRSEGEKMTLLKNILSILKSEKLYSKQTLLFHSKRTLKGTLPFKPCDMVDWIRKIFKGDLDSGNFVEKYFNSEINILSSMKIAAEHDKKSVSDVFNGLTWVLKSCDAPKLLDHLVPFLPLGFEDFDSRYTIGKLEEYIKLNCDHSKYGSDIVRVTLMATIQAPTFEILHLMIKHATAPQIKKYEAEYNFTAFIFKIIEFSNHWSHFSDALKFLITMMDKHNFNIVSSEVLVKKVPIIWKGTKNELFRADTSPRTFAFEVILKLMFLLMADESKSESFKTLQNTPEFETVIVDYLKHHWASQPHNPAALGVVWSRIKSERNKVLVKVLYAESTSLADTVGFLDYGNTETAKIFKYLSDIFVKYLVREPPLDTQYLIDLTRCMVVIARSSSLDEELYVLEDMVSPAMWLLEKQNDEKIVANVKEFIRILH